MLNITDEQKELFNMDSSQKDIILELKKQNDNKIYTITNENIISESLELNEAISTEKNIRYGQCVSTKFSIDVFNLKQKFGNDINFIGYDIKVYLECNNNDKKLYPRNNLYPLNNNVITSDLYPENIYPNGANISVSIPLFVGKVSESNLADNRNNRKLTAYDILYFKLNTNVSDLYWDDFIKNGRNAKYIREKILDNLGIIYEDVSLTNDNIELGGIADNYEAKKPTNITARNALESILEICGCFGHINRYGIFEFIELSKTYLNYPANKNNEKVKYPTKTLFIGRNIDFKNKNVESLNTYIKCKYDEKEISHITGVSFIKNNNIVVDEKIINTNNIYISKGNIYTEYFAEGLVASIGYISNALYQQINSITYIPSQIRCQGKPYIEVGDYIKITINNDDTNTLTIPVLKRNLKGIQSLIDTFEAKGENVRKI